jgi:ribosomal protein L6P/L9E
MREKLHSCVAGTLERDFKHTQLDLYVVEEEGEKKIKVDCHFGRRKTLAVIRTTCSHIQNLITGVTKVQQTSLAELLLLLHTSISLSQADGLVL